MRKCKNAFKMSDFSIVDIVVFQLLTKAKKLQENS